ncbi:c-type cytochrome [uncultured Tateyamaria sp.]|uniref:c-type cytochrome n=1 Tax=uncultured Tateyamaria sp. TaxID=455651 RepID=UPI002625F254|nr:c-type cytochrome [uncultured Tateyamaria sp.]
MWRALAIAVLGATPLAAQEFFTLRGHGGPIMDVTVSASGQIATASFDNSVGVWQGDVPAWHEGHRAAVNVVRFVDTGLLASGGDDNQLWLWADDTGRKALAHTAKIVDIAVSPDGQTIATASWDHRIGLTSVTQRDAPLPDWQISTAHMTGHKQGVNAVAFGGDGNTLYSASVDGTIRSWNVQDPTAASTVIAKHGFGVNELVVNDADGWLAYGATDGGTRILDLATGAPLADFTLDRRPILSMAYAPATKTLAVGDGQGFIMLIDTGAMQITHDFRAARNGPVWALAFSPDGQNLHAGGIEDIVYSWPVDTMTTLDPMADTPRSFLEKPETLANGERQFKRKCSICHTLRQGSARRAGPSLHALFGRRAGTVADYTYSETLRGSDIIWTAQTINALFDQGPDHYIPGTKMPMQRIVDPQDRDDLIDYLRTNTDAERDLK